jgi:hypothetical protein
MSTASIGTAAAKEYAREQLGGGEKLYLGTYHRNLTNEIAIHVPGRARRCTDGALAWLTGTLTKARNGRMSTALEIEMESAKGAYATARSTRLSYIQ